MCLLQTLISFLNILLFVYNYAKLCLFSCVNTWLHFWNVLFVCVRKNCRFVHHIVWQTRNERSLIAPIEIWMDVFFLLLLVWTHVWQKGLLLLQKSQLCLGQLRSSQYNALKKNRHCGTLLLLDTTCLFKSLVTQQEADLFFWKKYSTVNLMLANIQSHLC